MRSLRQTLPYLLPLALLGLTPACGVDQPPPPGLGGAGNTAPEQSLTFEPNSPLQLEPGKSAILAVRLTPPRSETIRFGVVGDDVNAAYLSTEQVVSSTEGRAFVTLFAPSKTGAFRVRAATDEGAETPLSAERSVVVGAPGFGAAVITLEGADKFPISEWRASAFPDATCGDLDMKGTTGAIWTTGPAPLTLSALPAGVPLAIVVSGAQIARGCATVEGLSNDEVKPVTVAIGALPFELSGGLDLELKIESVSEAFNAQLEDFVTAEFGGKDSGKTLLDAMVKLAPEGSQSTFTARRKAAGLDQILTTALESHGGLAGVFGEELKALARTLPDQPGFLGRLDLNPTPPSFQAVSCSGVPAKTALADNPMLVSLDVDFDGKFVSSSTLRLTPLRWLRDLAYLEANEGGTPLAERLGALAGCADLALASSASLAEEEAFAGCGTDCIEETCQSALEVLWESVGRNASVLALDLAQSGTLTRNDSGKLTGLRGAFLAVEGTDPMLEGALRGVDPPL
jgi:hypothetical protein